MRVSGDLSETSLTQLDLTNHKGAESVRRQIAPGVGFYPQEQAARVFGLGAQQPLGPTQNAVIDNNLSLGELSELLKGGNR